MKQPLLIIIIIITNPYFNTGKLIRNYIVKAVKTFLSNRLIMYTAALELATKAKALEGQGI